MSRRGKYTVSAATGAKRARKGPDPVTLPFGGSAVMAGNAGPTVAGDDELTALRRQLNLFATPPWAARAGGEIIAALDPLAKTCWEPAAGLGHMAGPLTDYFPAGVRASDVHDHGWPGLAEVRDFLDESGDTLRDGAWDWIVTNPPFSRAAEFAELGLKRARRGVALLCRLAFVESVGRYELMGRLALQAPFAERVPMQLGGWDPDLSSATAYAWFIWMTPEAMRESPSAPALRSAHVSGGHLTRLIPPGTRDRLWHADDRQIWAGEAPAAQLSLMGEVA